MRVNTSSPKISQPRDEIITTTTKYDHSFSEHIKTAKVAILRQQLDEELDKITKQGERFCRSNTLKDLLIFKNMVRDFMKTCISEGLKYKEERSLGFKKTKILSLVEKVNKKLVNLMDEFVLENQDPIKLVSIIDEIRGLLLDLYI